MTTLKFADTHNLVVCFAKPAESDGFYANSLVDGKKIIVTEASVRSDLQLDDAEGMNCLLNATIFEELTRIGYEKISQSAKTTTWNEFSSTMASAIICLATNQKFNFSKYIFESMVKNLENVTGKFLMYPRFVQVFLEKQLDDMSNHNRIYIIPSHTKKIFRNMKRVGKSFSRRETPLFPTMVVQAQAEMGEDEAVYKVRDDSLVRAATTATSLEAEQDSGNIDKTRSKATLNEPSPQGIGLGSGPRHQDTMGDTIAQTGFENVSKTSNDSLLIEEDASKQGRKIDDIDKDVEITLVDETQGRINDEEMFDTCVLNHEEVFAGQDMAQKEINLAKKEDSTTDLVTTSGEVVTTASVEVSIASPTEATIDDELTLAQTLIEIKSKGIMEDPEKLTKKKDQIRLNEELSFRLQAKKEEEVRLAREKAKKEQEANVALTEEWNDIQEKIEADQLLADQLLAKRLQAREQEELTIEEMAKLFQ
ncbi:hypothetical protein Tco_1515328 [Tanacetum coccineum]